MASTFEWSGHRPLVVRRNPTLYDRNCKDARLLIQCEVVVGEHVKHPGKAVFVQGRCRSVHHDVVLIHDQTWDASDNGGHGDHYMHI